MFFYLLTMHGVHRAECNAADLVQRRDPLANLFEICNVAMAEVRKIEQSRPSRA